MKVKELLHYINKELEANPEFTLDTPVRFWEIGDFELLEIETITESHCRTKGVTFDIEFIKIRERIE